MAESLRDLLAERGRKVPPWPRPAGELPAHLAEYEGKHGPTLLAFRCLREL